MCSAFGFLTVRCSMPCIWMVARVPRAALRRTLPRRAVRFPLRFDLRAPRFAAALRSARVSVDLRFARRLPVLRLALRAPRLAAALRSARYSVLFLRRFELRRFLVDLPLVLRLLLFLAAMVSSSFRVLSFADRVPGF